MFIAPLIKRVARGKHGSEHLSRSEARDLFQALLREDADLLQLGAFLIAQRMKGETSPELAGFVDATRYGISGIGTCVAPAGAVDLPCYAGKRRSAHAYLAAALKARDQGVPIVVHGVAQIDGRVTAWQVLQKAGVQRAVNLADAVAILHDENIVYLDLADVSPDLFRIYNLRSRLGVRSFANTVARLLNPLQCDGQLNGFFHTPYAAYMADANVLLGQLRSMIFMGAEGEPELYADRQKVVMKQQGEILSRVSFPEAGLPAYPRQPMDEGLLKGGFVRMLKGELSEREIAVVNRMGEAFDWASHGELPLNWLEHKL